MSLYLLRGFFHLWSVLFFLQEIIHWLLTQSPDYSKSPRSFLIHCASSQSGAVLSFCMDRDHYLELFCPSAWIVIHTDNLYASLKAFNLVHGNMTHPKRAPPWHIKSQTNVMKTTSEWWGWIGINLPIRKTKDACPTSIPFGDHQ